MKKDATKDNTLYYKDYLESKKKSDIEELVQNFHLEYKKNSNKDLLIDIVIKNINLIVDDIFDIFQEDEYENIKLIVKKNGNIRVKVNHYLRKFLDNFERLNLIKKIDNNHYQMPIDLVKAFEEKIGNRKILDKVKQNTEEYKIINGFIETYGYRSTKDLYEVYKEVYDIPLSKFEGRMLYLADFYNEFKVYQDKTGNYISSSSINGISKGKKILNKKIKYKEFNYRELISIYDFTKFKKVKSYKKLKKYIARNYYVEKGSFKIINRFILAPFLKRNQLEKDKSKKYLEEELNKYFEIKNNKNKEKFIYLINEFAKDYPSWSLQGNTERGKNSEK